MKVNILGYDSVVLLVMGNVHVNSEMVVVTESILRICRLRFEDAHEGRVQCLYVRMSECMCMC